MRNNCFLNIFIILIISFFVKGNAIAFYKPKMVVIEFDDSKNWNKPFSPGKTMAHQLQNALIKKNNFQISKSLRNVKKSRVK